MSESVAETGATRPRPNGVAIVGFTLAPILGAIWIARLPATALIVAVVVVGVGALVTWSPYWVVVAVALVVGVRADGALELLTAARSGPVDGQAITMVSDPRDGAFGAWAIVEFGDERLVASVTGLGASLVSVDAGDELLVTGSVIGRSPESNWEVSNHLVGSLRIVDVVSHDEATGLAGLANRFRDVLADGARSLSPQRRALLAGLTVGDDREQSAVTADDFQAAGLGHLLAVSGQNVVFVLIIAGPLLKRVRSPGLQVAATIAVLVLFGFVTRFEPSVTRALSMVSLAVIASAVGRPADASRTLPVAVLGLLLWDPLLAWSLAFQLSVAATLGLLVIAPVLQDRFRGPEVLRGLLSATIGAQLAVAPLLVLIFDGVSLIALPANLLAVPVSGVIMMWGMTAGFVAGVVPAEIAALIHLPTSIGLWWLETVARFAATAPVAPLASRGAVIVLGAGGLAVVARWVGYVGLSRLASVLVILALAVPLLTPRPLPAGRHQLDPGLTVFRHGRADLVVLDGARDPEDVLALLRRARLGRIDLVVAVSGSRDDGRVVRAIDERYDIVDIWAPVGHQVPNARTVPGLQGTLGSLGIRVNADGEVEVFSDEESAGDRLTSGG